MAELTAEEQAHQTSLEKLLKALRKASADPATSIGAREVLGPEIAGLEDQLDELQEGVFSQNTGDIEAQEEALAPALELLQTLKAKLAKVASGIKDVATIASYVDGAIATCESLLG